MLKSAKNNLNTLYSSMFLHKNGTFELLVVPDHVSRVPGNHNSSLTLVVSGLLLLLLLVIPYSCSTPGSMEAAPAELLTWWLPSSGGQSQGCRPPGLTVRGSRGIRGFRSRSRGPWQGIRGLRSRSRGRGRRLVQLLTGRWLLRAGHLRRGRMGSQPPPRKGDNTLQLD